MPPGRRCCNIVKPHYIGHRQRLRDRFAKSGLAGFADYEVIELLLTLVIPRHDGKAPAKEQIERCGNLRGILDALASVLRPWRWTSLETIGALPNQVLEIAYLDTKQCLLRDGVERREEGTIDRATGYIRRVMEAALGRGAAAIVLSHNHSNGHTQPSDKDKTLTRALLLAAETVQLRIVDHLIVSSAEVFSFRTAGLL